MSRKARIAATVILLSCAVVVSKEPSSDGEPSVPEAGEAAVGPPDGTRASHGDDEPVTEDDETSFVISGTITDADGEPVGHACVSLLNHHERDYTDEKGSYEVRLAADSRGEGHLIFARHADRNLAALVTKGEDDVVDIQLADGVTIVGQVIGADGETPVAAGGDVWIDQPGWDDPRYWNLAGFNGAAYLVESMPADGIDAEGNFTVCGIPQGLTCYVMVEAEGYGYSYITVDLPADATEIEVEQIVLPKDRSISGVIVDSAGNPVADAHVRVVGQRILGLWCEETTWSDDAGRFTLDEVIDDTVAIFVRVPGTKLFGHAEVPADTTDVRIELQEAPWTDPDLYKPRPKDEEPAEGA